MNIGDRIRELRKGKKMTQRELAALSDMAENTIRQYELHLRQPKVAQLKNIANALDCSLDYLTGVEKDNSIAFHLEKIYSELGYDIYVDDPEHPRYIIHNSSKIKVSLSQLEALQERILSFNRFSLDELIEKCDE